MMNTDQVFTQGITAYRNGNYREAEKLFKQVLAGDPFSPETLLNLGNVYFKLGENGKAEESWQKVIEINPVEDKAYLNLGNLYYSRQCYNKAISYYKIFQRLNPNHAFAHYNLGLTYEAVGQLVEAHEHFKQFMHLNARSPEAVELKKRLREMENISMHNLIQAERYLNAGKLNEAKRAYESSILLYPCDTKYYKHYASVLYHLADLNEALKWYEYANKLNPTDTGVLVNLGVLYDKQKKMLDACWAFYKVTELCQDKTPMKVQKRYREICTEVGISNMAPHVQKMHEWLKNGDYDMVERLLPRLNDLAQEHGGNQAAELKAVAEALKERNNPVNKAAKIAFALAEDFKDAGQYDKALPFYKRYLELLPDGEKAAVVKERMDHIDKTIKAVVGGFINDKSLLAG